jgi:hypothetical protein
MVLIDNVSYSYSFQLENGIPILSYYDGNNDSELKASEAYLNKLATYKDVWELNEKPLSFITMGSSTIPRNWWKSYISHGDYLFYMILSTIIYV